MATAQLKKWSESVASSPERIDRDEGIIYGVKVLGLESKNRRTYQLEAARKAIPLYEGAEVYIDHPPRGKQLQERSRRDHWGVLKNVRESNGGIYADLHYLKSHRDTEQILEAVERFPDTFGLSHNAEGEEKVINGKNVVTAIESVFSVDLVSRPATNKSLFESSTTMKKTTVKAILEANEANPLAKTLVEMMAPEDGEKASYMPEEMELDVDDSASPEETIKQAFKALCMSILEMDVPMPEMISKLKTVLKAKSEVSGAVTTTPAPVEDIAIEPIEDDDTMTIEESQRLAAENAKLKNELESIKIRAAVEKLLVESKREVTDVRVKALIALPDADRKSLVESWPVVGQATKQRPSASPSKTLVESIGKESPKDFESFKKALQLN